MQNIGHWKRETLSSSSSPIPQPFSVCQNCFPTQAYFWGSVSVAGQSLYHNLELLKINRAHWSVPQHNSQGCSAVLDQSLVCLSSQINHTVVSPTTHQRDANVCDQPSKCVSRYYNVVILAAVYLASRGIVVRGITFYLPVSFPCDISRHISSQCKVTWSWLYYLSP